MKQFSLRHERSANKVGVDGVLIGAWADIQQLHRPDSQDIKVLDAGCGCGLIALILAQRIPDAEILGIDIDEESIVEARLNVSESPWSNRVSIKHLDFQSLINGVEIGEVEPFDMIVSNPPFFHAGLTQEPIFGNSRLIARHAVTLSPESLVENARILLNPGGNLALIAEANYAKNLIQLAIDNELTMDRICYVKGNPRVDPKRVMLQFRAPELKKNVSDKSEQSCKSESHERKTLSGTLPKEMPEMRSETLIIETCPGSFTREYIDLCKPFYLKM